MPKKRTSRRKTPKKACDYGHFARYVHRLDTGGHSGVNLCERHWIHEMAWRRGRNKTLDKSAKFPILKWRSSKKRR